MPAETLDMALEADGILLVQLHRPDHLNAFTVQMCRDLETLFDMVNQDDAVRAVIITGSGRAFCAGMDLGVGDSPFGLDYTLDPTIRGLRERSDDPNIANHVRDTGGRVSLAIARCLKPVIAAINGAAVGVGATMTLPMDMRIASTHARIGFVFGRIGIVPEACSSWFLPRIVGLPRALEWTHTAAVLSAEEALAGGLVREVVEPEALLDTAREWARRVTSDRSSVATALTRQMMIRSSAFADPLEAHHVETLAVFHVAQRDGREGVAAFREKRSPHFTSRVSADMPDMTGWWPEGQG